jgi:glycosyltransferase involved in cell wall biosynthesis
MQQYKNRQENMIYLALPVGSYHGWGVCGKYITKELSNVSGVTLVTNEFSFQDILDEFDFRFLTGKLISKEENEIVMKNEHHHVHSPVLQCIQDKSLVPILPNLKGTLNVGYTFFEDSNLLPSYIENGRKYFDTVVAGSTWCEDVLRENGLANVKTVIQGIDPSIFNPFYAEKEYMCDSFVIFSGGKFELRKGQDIVIKAFKHLQDKYSDVLLVNSWFNLWPFSYQTMAASPYIRTSSMSGDFFSMLNRVLYDNGIDSRKVISLPIYPNTMMARIYKNTDIGLFPNRCEGGTNLVLMEYMARGKPVIASYNTGHRDILTDENSLKLTGMKYMPVQNNIDIPNIAQWEEPDIDEVIGKLEWAYLNRDSLRATGIRAGEALGKMTWEKTAAAFYEILTA